MKTIGSSLPANVSKRIQVVVDRAGSLHREGDPIPAVKKTQEEIADETWKCPKCLRTLGLLQSIGKTRRVQGYLQCVYCSADIDCCTSKPRKVSAKAVRAFVHSFGH